jgi:hypothetical protein
MIVVTLCAVIPCGYIGWQAKIFRDRVAAVNEIRGSGGMIIGVEGLSPSALVPGLDYSIPFLRRCLGDHAVFLIIYKYGITDDEFRRLRSIFPEAIFEPDSPETHY